MKEHGIAWSQGIAGIESYYYSATYFCIYMKPPLKDMTHSNMFLDGPLERWWVRSHDIRDLFAILEQHKRRHGADVELLCHVGHFVDVELVEARSGVGV